MIETIERMIGDLESWQTNPPPIRCFARHFGRRCVCGAGCACISAGTGRISRCQPEPRYRAGP